MSVRHRHSGLLEKAAELLSRLSASSPLPEVLLGDAILNAKTVFEEAAGAGKDYMLPQSKTALRVAIVSLNGMMNIANDEDRDFSEADLQKIREVSSVIRHVAAGVLQDPRSPKLAPTEAPRPVAERPTYSALGLRMKSLGELANAKPYVEAAHDLHSRKAVEVAAPKEDEHPEMPRSVNDAASQVAKLPVKVPSGALYVAVRMPIIAYPKGNINEAALKRNGVDYVRIRGLSAPKDHAVAGLPALTDAGYLLFNNQTVYGYETKNLTAKNVAEMIRYWSSRRGPQANPLDKKTADQTIQHKTIRFKGSHLNWIWLVPDRWMSSGAINVIAATFPTLTDEPAHVRDKREREERRDLTNLEQTEKNINKLNEKIKNPHDKALMDPRDAARLAELRQKKNDGPRASGPLSVQDKTARLEDLKKLMEAQLRKKFSKQYAEIEVLHEDLVEVDRQRQPLKEKIKAIQDVIDADRDAKLLKTEKSLHQIDQLKNALQVKFSKLYAEIKKLTTNMRPLDKQRATINAKIQAAQKIIDDGTPSVRKDLINLSPEELQKRKTLLQIK